MSVREDVGSLTSQSAQILALHLRTLRLGCWTPFVYEIPSIGILEYTLLPKSCTKLATVVKKMTLYFLLIRFKFPTLPLAG